MADIAFYSEQRSYQVGDYCNNHGQLCRCIQNTPNPAGAFSEEYWSNLGNILDGKGFVTIKEGNIEFDEKSYLNKQGDTTLGNIGYNIPNATSSTRIPIRFIKGSGKADTTVYAGAGGTTLVASGNAAASDSFLPVYGIMNPDSKNIYLASNNEIIFLTNANGTSGNNGFKEALKINNLGEITVLSKSVIDGNGNPTLLATEAQVMNIANKKLDKAGGTVTGQIKGVKPVNKEDLTRKDYVDDLVDTTKNTLNDKIDGLKGVYVPLTGGVNITNLLKCNVDPKTDDEMTRKKYVDDSINGKFQVVNSLPAKIEPDIFYFIPEK